MRVLSWNVERLKAGAINIAKEILRHEPDVVALQEYQPGHIGAELTKFLEASGYAFQLTNPFNNGFCSCVIARVPMQAVAIPRSLPQGNWASYWVEASCDVIGLSCIHVPIPKYREQRNAYWKAALEHCADIEGRPHLLVGDFNTTRHGIDEKGTTVPGDHWLQALEKAGWQEAWRTSNGDLRDYSWFSKADNGFRLDQAWLSPSASNHLRDARMCHSPRLAGLSDHSVLIVDLDIRK